MSLPPVLVIDDQYGGDDETRLLFLENSGTRDLERGESLVDEPVAGVVFCSGQRRSGEYLYNDYRVIRDAVAAGPPGGGDWALVLLDVRFDSRPPDPADRAHDDDFGEEVRKRLAADFPDLPVVMLSSKRQEELRDRDVPYLAKLGLTPRDITIHLLRHGRITPEQRRILLALPADVVADDPAAIAVFVDAFRVAGGDASVLILGETGSGKDVLAHYIHARSPRADRAFVPVNVAAIPAELVESILFGHEKGAFTGAERKQTGLFVRADGGTLFLDEIGDMPPALQIKVLRALQDGEVLPVGAAGPVRVNVRVISATSRDIDTLRREGRFRDDLLRRISGETLVMPPLRQRPEDMVALARLFLSRYSKAAGKEGITFEAEALARLRQHPFAGNVGELDHVVQSLVNRKGNHSLISARDVALALETSFISSGRGRAEQAPPAGGGDESLARLAGIMEAWPVSPDDPALEGGKPRLESAFRGLLARMAGAALERFRDPRNGRFNRQAAMQWLTGDAGLRGKGPGRVINEILGRRADTPVSKDDLEELAAGFRGARETMTKEEM